VRHGRTDEQELQVEGFYSVSFITPLGEGSGIMLASNGVLRGGDTIIYYTGTYSVSGDVVSAKLATRRHSYVPGLVSVFGPDEVHMRLEGRRSGNEAKLSGVAREAPEFGLIVTLRRIDE
jgi:hypothetical protein